MDQFIKSMCDSIKESVASAIQEGISEGLKKSKVNEKKEIEFLTKKQAASFLGISIPTLDKRIEEGCIISHRMGGMIRFKKHEIESSLTIRKFSKFGARGGNNEK